MARIVQLTDLHLFADARARLFGIPTRETLVDVLAHLRAHAGHVDHLVVTGDHAHDERAGTYDTLRELLGPWHDRLWQVPGNHDDRARLRAAFPDRITGTGARPVRFAYRVERWLCVGLDTQVPGEVGGRLDGEQVGWLRERLDEHDPEAVALFLHHPPVALGCPWLDAIGLEGRELLAELLEADSRFRLVCCGHVHHESTTRLGAATVVTTPSTGLQFDPTGASAAFAGAPPGYRVVDLDGDAWSTHVVRLPVARFAPTPPDAPRSAGSS